MTSALTDQQDSARQPADQMPRTPQVQRPGDRNVSGGGQVTDAWHARRRLLTLSLPSRSGELRGGGQGCLLGQHFGQAPHRDRGLEEKEQGSVRR